MAINKVVYGSTTLIDLTDSTLSDPSDLMSGVTAYDRTGTLLTGTGTGGGGDYIITYDDSSSVGLAEVGDAVTGGTELHAERRHPSDHRRVGTDDRGNG